MIGVDIIQTLTSAVNVLMSSGYHPLLVALCFAIWRLVDRYGADPVTSGVFAFAIPYVPLWIIWLANGLSFFATSKAPAFNLQSRDFITVEIAAGTVLFVICAAASALALRGGRSLKRPVVIVVALILAHALQVQVISKLTAWSLN